MALSLTLLNITLLNHTPNLTLLLTLNPTLLTLTLTVTFGIADPQNSGPVPNSESSIVV